LECDGSRSHTLRSDDDHEISRPTVTHTATHLTHYNSTISIHDKTTRAKINKHYVLAPLLSITKKSIYVHPQKGRHPRPDYTLDFAS
jgi:hypothetical protein